MNDGGKWFAGGVIVLVLAVLAAYCAGVVAGEGHIADREFPVRQWALVDMTSNTVVASGYSREQRTVHVATGWKWRLQQTGDIWSVEDGEPRMPKRPEARR